MSQGDNGKMVLKTTINPLVTVDEWAVLSDGSVAFIRGHDYHIDWLRPDGTTASTAKLPFDWKRLTDEDKQKLIDSARAAQAEAAAKAAADKSNPDALAKAAMQRRPEVAQGAVRPWLSCESDPAIWAAGAAQRRWKCRAPDRWRSRPRSSLCPPRRLPTITRRSAPARRSPISMATSGSSRPHRRSRRPANWSMTWSRTRVTSLERVRMPVGRSIAGFGRGGILYLMGRDQDGSWYLERTRIVEDKRVTQ